MSNKSEFALGLPEVNPDADIDINVHLDDAYLPASFKHQMYAEAIKHRYAIDAVREKTRYGMSKIAELNQHAVTEFEKTADFNEKVKRLSQGKDHQKYMEEFCHYMTQVTAQQISGVAKVGNTIITQVIAQSPYPAPDQKDNEPRGFLSRLFNI